MTNSSSAPSRPSINARAEELGHAEHAHLGDAGLEHGEQDAADGELGDIGREADASAPRAACAGGRCPTARRGRRSARRRAAASATPPASISARWRPEYSSTIASCTMVSSRCVAGLSTGMRAFSAIATMISATSARPSDTRRPTVRRCMKSAMVDSWVVPASSASGEHDHDHRRLGERGDHHLAAGADAAEAGADIHAGQRQEEAARCRAGRRSRSGRPTS